MTMRASITLAERPPLTELAAEFPTEFPCDMVGYFATMRGDSLRERGS